MGLIYFVHGREEFTLCTTSDMFVPENVRVQPEPSMVVVRRSTLKSMTKEGSPDNGDWITSM